jgi:hypothetical protein
MAMQYLGSGIWFQRRITCGGHFFRDGAGDDEEIGLTRGRAEDFGAETGDVEFGHRGGDHLDRAASEAEVEGPDRVTVAPRVELLEAGQENALAAEFGALGVGNRGWGGDDFLTQGAILPIQFNHGLHG